jgi:hypothetical protein
MGMFDEGPEGPMSARGNHREHPDLTVMVNGQMGDNSAQILAIG